MQEEMGKQDLEERLALIESMMAEGRREYKSRGWAFVLWGVAFYVAYFWAAWGHFAYAWPVTMVVAGLLTVAGFMRNTTGPSTALGRAVGSVWIAGGISMFVLFCALGFSGHMTDRLFFAAVAAILGLVNVACGLILKWRIESACGVAWWVAAVVASVGSVDMGADAFLAAVFLCQIVFGIYAMVLDSKRRKRSGVVHA